MHVRVRVRARAQLCVFHTTAYFLKSCGIIGALPNDGGFIRQLAARVYPTFVPPHECHAAVRGGLGGFS